MTLNEYQQKAMATCLPTSNNQLYMLFGLCEEVGELHGKFAKGIRKGIIPIDGEEPSWDEEYLENIKKECGDVAWMLAGICNVMGWTLEEVCQLNIDKLASRKQRGVIDSEGDNR